MDETKCDRLLVKNWKEYQHYKDRTPPWIKLHRSIFDDYEFQELTEKQQYDLIRIWILASTDEGSIPNQEAILRRLCRMSRVPDLQALISKGFLIPSASTMLPQRKHFVPLEKETEKETEKESTTSVAKKTPRGRKLTALTPIQNVLFKACGTLAWKSFKESNNQTPSWVAKDKAQLAALIRRKADLTLEEFSRRWKIYSEARDAFTVKQGMSLGFFCSRFDRYAKSGDWKEGLTDDDGGVY